ncbi:MAG: DUF4007 family protein [Clostridia bacterium]
MCIKVRLKANESFVLREGWLKKGLDEVIRNPKIFSAKDAVIDLGIGSNMVKALKYYMKTMKLIKEKKVKNSGYELTEMAELILKYDPYIQEMETLWFLHINFIQDDVNAFVYNYIFTNYKAKKFTKEDLQNKLEEYLEYNNIKFSENSLKDDIASFIKTYTKTRVENPETDLNCPLADLEIVKKIDRNTIEKIIPNFTKLNVYVVYYALITMLNEKNEIGIDEILYGKNSPGSILNLDKNLVNMYLEEMKKENLIEINRTAGLDMVYINKKKSLKEIFEKTYK